MRCRECEESLPAYRDQTLHGPRLAAVRRHLSRCHGCRQALAEARLLPAGLDVRLSDWSPPDDFVAATVRRARTESADSRPSARPEWLRRHLLALVIATAILFILPVTRSLLPYHDPASRLLSLDVMYPHDADSSPPAVADLAERLRARRDAAERARRPAGPPAAERRLITSAGDALGTGPSPRGGVPVVMVKLAPDALDNAAVCYALAALASTARLEGVPLPADRDPRCPDWLHLLEAGNRAPRFAPGADDDSARSDSSHFSMPGWRDEGSAELRAALRRLAEAPGPAGEAQVDRAAQALMRYGERRIREARRPGDVQAGGEVIFDTARVVEEVTARPVRDSGPLLDLAESLSEASHRRDAQAHDRLTWLSQLHHVLGQLALMAFLAALVLVVPIVPLRMMPRRLAMPAPPVSRRLQAGLLSIWMTVAVAMSLGCRPWEITGLGQIGEWMGSLIVAPAIVVGAILFRLGGRWSARCGAGRPRLGEWLDRLVEAPPFRLSPRWSYVGHAWCQLDWRLVLLFAWLWLSLTVAQAGVTMALADTLVGHPYETTRALVENLAAGR